MTRYRTTVDIVIPAGTEVREAATITRRAVPFGEAIMGHGPHSTSEWLMPLFEAIAEGLVEEVVDNVASSL